jgi:hypothetical protein
MLLLKGWSGGGEFHQFLFTSKTFILKDNFAVYTCSFFFQYF